MYFFHILLQHLLLLDVGLHIKGLQLINLALVLYMGRNLKSTCQKLKKLSQ